MPLGHWPWGHILARRRECVFDFFRPIVRQHNAGMFSQLPAFRQVYEGQSAMLIMRVVSEHHVAIYFSVAFPGAISRTDTLQVCHVDGTTSGVECQPGGIPA